MGFMVTLVTVPAAILSMGNVLDRWMEPGVRTRLGVWLGGQVSGGPGRWTRTTSNLFIELFDKVYRGRGSVLEDGIWVALFSGALSAVAFDIVIGLLLGVHGNFKIVGLALAISGIATGFSFLAFFIYRWIPIYRESNIPKMLAAIFFYIVLVVSSSVLISLYSEEFLAKELPRWLEWFTITTIFSAWVIPLLLISQIRIPVHPLKAVASSLIFLVVISVLKPEVTNSFFDALDRDGIFLLGFLALNLYADGLSLVKTRYILKRGADSSFRVICGLLVLDLVLSAAIFLILPITLGEAPSILRGIYFGGDRPWLGLLFWTTFSTSIVWYLFAAAAIVVHPTATLLRWLSIPFNLREHPARCLSIVIAVEFAVLLVAGGILTVLTRQY